VRGGDFIPAVMMTSLLESVVSDRVVGYRAYLRKPFREPDDEGGREDIVEIGGVPRMLRNAPHFAAWCAADPGS
jgi:hypothetical protein